MTMESQLKAFLVKKAALQGLTYEEYVSKVLLDSLSSDEIEAIAIRIRLSYGYKD